MKSLRNILLYCSVVMLVGCGKTQPPAPASPAKSDDKSVVEAQPKKVYLRSELKIAVIHAKPPLTMDQVKDLLGPPFSTTEAKQSNQNFWAYKGISRDEANDKIDKAALITFKDKIAVDVEFTP